MTHTISVSRLQEQRALLMSGDLAAVDVALVAAAIDTLLEIEVGLSKKALTIAKLNRLLFGAKTETGASGNHGQEGRKKQTSKAKKQGTSNTQQRRKGGRLGVEDYPKAKNIEVPHADLKKGCTCPLCQRGRLYQLDPSRVLHLWGGPPIQANCFHLERLRCSSCQAVFTAPEPESVAKGRHDPSAKSMVCLLKYGAGLPLFRQDRLQSWLGVPLPASTQFDLIESVVDAVFPVYRALLDFASNASVIHMDDTGVVILDVLKEARQGRAQRTATHTTCFVAKEDGHEARLYFAGVKHAGQNLTDLLDRRGAHDPPIVMSDALGLNFAHHHHTRNGNCLAHGRRQFYELMEMFPDEVNYVLLKIGVVYANEAHTQRMDMTPEERLAYHRRHSRAPMDCLKHWLQALFEERRIEPNSTFGKAITYMLKHWQRLTLFLREPGAPLDNNPCERAIKSFVLMRKNSLFYKTQFGALAGNVLISLIQTCVAAGENPFDYLNALQIHAKFVAAEPTQWLPWNFRSNTSMVAVA